MFMDFVFSKVVFAMKFDLDGDNMGVEDRS